VVRPPAPVVAAPPPVVAAPPAMNDSMMNAAAAPPMGPAPGMIPPGYKKGTAKVAHKGHEKIHDSRHVAEAAHFPIGEHAKLHMKRHAA
jgi:hypothetical protein